MTHEFDNLPLIEVAIRMTLDSRLPADLAFIIDLYHQMQAEFPNVSDLPAIEVPPGAQAEWSFSPVPSTLGARFANLKSNVSVLVQRDMLSVRWSRPATDPVQGMKSNYPRFTTGMVPALQSLMTALDAILGEDALRFSAAHMTYVNFLVSEEPLKAEALSRYIRGVPSGLYGDSTKFNALDVSYGCEDGTDIRITVQSANVAGAPGFLLASSGGALLGTSSATETFHGLSRVHDALNKMFGDAITEDAAVEWKKSR